jgi:hypothetical protein
MKRISLVCMLLQAAVICTFSRNSCYSRLENDTLTIGNSLIERTFLWNGGNLITCTLTDKHGNRRWENLQPEPDFRLSSKPLPTNNASYAARTVKATSIRPEHLEITVAFSSGDLDVRHVYRIYDSAPAIARDTYLRGIATGMSAEETINLSETKSIESVDDAKSGQDAAILDQIRLRGKHWKMTAVEFFDVTDWNNNLVSEKNFLSYRKNVHRGNLLFARNEENRQGLFFLKESPSSGARPADGGDFTTEFGHFAVVGTGICNDDLKGGEWVKTPGCVVGVYGGNELNRLTALRLYQKNLRRLLPERDEMVMMNTWGDRSQDAKINESFVIREIERAAALGITHFQIDDGWQTGKSPNSAIAKGSFDSIWDRPDYWTPDSVKFPAGLHPVVKRAAGLGIQIGLWFNPSMRNEGVDWEKDAQAIIDLYQTYGISVFKIDGVSIPTKKSEANLRKLFDQVLEATGNRVVFNLDVTAGRRSGYHTFNEYGNIFLENRYTDWQNYYPYQTLRNLWQLSRYVPAERLQIEFLNKWRNTDQYVADRFAPANYAFEYLFAVTLAGQPLAWLEGTRLPAEALQIERHISSYKKVQHDFHSGIILPAGDEPSGRSWTGFQSLKGAKEGYFIFFREDHPDEKACLKTWLPEGVTVSCVPLIGHAKPMQQTTGRGGTLEVELPTINSFVMYKYKTD